MLSLKRFDGYLRNAVMIAFVTLLAAVTACAEVGAQTVCFSLTR